MLFAATTYIWLIWRIDYDIPYHMITIGFMKTVQLQQRAIYVLPCTDCLYMAHGYDCMYVWQMRRLARPLAQVSSRAIRRHNNGSIAVNVNVASRLLTTASATAASAPRVYGGLKDQDRIFTNLYGEKDWGIDGALKRVCKQHHVFLVLATTIIGCGYYDQ